MHEHLFCSLRHAEPISEEEGLTAKGQLQAKSLILPSFDAVFCSPAKRAYETAEIVAPSTALIVIPELYLFNLSENQLLRITERFRGQSTLVVSHGGIANQIAAFLSPTFAPTILGKTLKHAEGFLLEKGELYLVSSFINSYTFDLRQSSWD